MNEEQNWEGFKCVLKINGGIGTNQDIHLEVSDMKLSIYEIINHHSSLLVQALNAFEPDLEIDEFKLMDHKVLAVIWPNDCHISTKFEQLDLIRKEFDGELVLMGEIRVENSKIMELLDIISFKRASCTKKTGYMDVSIID